MVNRFSLGFRIMDIGLIKDLSALRKKYSTHYQESDDIKGAPDGFESLPVAGFGVLILHSAPS